MKAMQHCFPWKQWRTASIKVSYFNSNGTKTSMIKKCIWIMIVCSQLHTVPFHSPHLYYSPALQEAALPTSSTTRLHYEPMRRGYWWDTHTLIQHAGKHEWWMERHYIQRIISESIALPRMQRKGESAPICMLSRPRENQPSHPVWSFTCTKYSASSSRTAPRGSFWDKKGHVCKAAMLRTHGVLKKKKNGTQFNSAMMR